MDHHFPGTSHLTQLGSDLGNFEARSGLTLFVEHLRPFLRIFFFFFLRDRTHCSAGDTNGSECCGTMGMCLFFKGVRLMVCENWQLKKMPGQKIVLCSLLLNPILFGGAVGSCCAALGDQIQILVCALKGTDWLLTWDTCFWLRFYSQMSHCCDTVIVLTVLVFSDKVFPSSG